jgi:UTP--glucose-1-phosphate uridylyltransferase
MKIRKAMIPAAGLGTRFLPATKAMPKEMLPIIDKPTIQFIVEEVVASGIEQLLIVTNKGKRAMEDHFDRAYELEDYLQRKGKSGMLSKVRHPSQLIDIQYVRQSEAKGLGHSIRCAKSFAQREPFAVLLGDTFLTSTTPCLKQMIDTYLKYETSIIGVKPIELEKSTSYGMIQADPIDHHVYRVRQLVEKPQPHEAPSNLAMIGRYILSPAIFEILDHQQPGVGGEIQLTDAIEALLQHESVHACQIEGTWHDVGDPLGYIQTILCMSLMRGDLQRKVLDMIHQVTSQHRV